MRHSSPCFSVVLMSTTRRLWRCQQPRMAHSCVSRTLVTLSKIAVCVCTLRFVGPALTRPKRLSRRASPSNCPSSCRSPLEAFRAIFSRARRSGLKPRHRTYSKLGFALTASYAKASSARLPRDPSSSEQLFDLGDIPQGSIRWL
eukprot:6183673-Pleurochrysis_carterae.AAC.2